MASDLKLEQLQLRSFRTQVYGQRKKNAHMSRHCPVFVLNWHICLKLAYTSGA